MKEPEKQTQQHVPTGAGKPAPSSQIPTSATERKEVGSYEYTEGCWTLRIGKEGEREALANFCAWITRETTYRHAGTDQESDRHREIVLTIEGKQVNAEGAEVILPAVEVDTEDFGGMGWVMDLWGTRAVIFASSSVREHLRIAIQSASQPEQKTVYRSTGWAISEGKRIYVHGGGAISQRGDDKGVRVDLPNEMRRYKIELGSGDGVKGTRATLDLRKIGPKDVMWPLIGAAIAPLHGPVDFAVHLTGRTGTFKSEVVSLIQSHYGPEMDARHLPGSWSSTANALEAQAFYAANAVFVVDDFVPMGTSWQVRAYQTTADKLIRAQGNQSGRARLTDVSRLQTTMYPRGIVLSTGEDTPEGHSVRARMMILELSPDDIDPGLLSKAQKARALYSQGLAHYIRRLAEDWPGDTIEQETRDTRDKSRELGHTRTPAMYGRILASLRHYIAWAEEIKAVTSDQAKALLKEAEESLKMAANNQSQYLEAADPTDNFGGILRQILASGLGHVRTLKGGVPRSPLLLGWTKEGDEDAAVPTYRSHGPVIGWADWVSGELLLDITTGVNLIKRVAGAEIALTKQTLIKRLKDGAMLSRVDDARQRNTVRVTAEGHPRQVIALKIGIISEGGDMGGDDGEEDDE